ncbi:MAG: hypothetical protein RLY60_1075 [Pseudomonadota bacterium]
MRISGNIYFWEFVTHKICQNNYIKSSYFLKVFMSTFANQLKSEIARISKKEIKAENAALKKASSHYRSEIASLKRRLSSLESSIARLTKHTVTAPAVVAEDDSEKSLRFRPTGFAKLRQKLDLSANEMGALLGVTGQSVYKWEKGTARPRASQLKAIAAVRKMGKKQVLELLAG